MKVGQMDRQMDRPNEMPKGIKTSPFTLNHHMLASFRTFFSFAGPSNKKKDLPSLSSWTCWRNCQSETAVCLTPDISGSLRSRCSPLVSLPVAFVLWPLPPLCSPRPDLGQPSPFHAPTSLPLATSLPYRVPVQNLPSRPWSLLLPWLLPRLSLPDEGWCPSESGPQVQGDALNAPSPESTTRQTPPGGLAFRNSPLQGQQPVPTMASHSFQNSLSHEDRSREGSQLLLALSVSLASSLEALCPSPSSFLT